MAAAQSSSNAGASGSMHLPTPRDVVHSVKAYTAAMIALLIGFSQNLENPYWSALTIYIIVNPPGAGAFRSKSLFRLVGNLMGGVVTIILAGLFADDIGILVTVVIAAIVAALYVQHIDKTPTNYIWFALAVSISVIALNNVTKPSSIFDIATARVAEISIGILAMMLVDTVWTEPMTPKFLETMGEWRGKARGWLLDALVHRTPDHDDEARRTAARDQLREIIKGVDTIDQTAVQLPFDLVDAAPRKRHLDLLRRQVAATIGDLIAIELRIGALRRTGAVSADLDHRLDAVSAWVADGPDLPGAMVAAQVARGEALAEELAQARDAIDPAAGRGATIEHSLLAQLAAFTRDWCDLSLVLSAISTGRRLPERLEQAGRRAKPVRSVDYLGAALDMVPMIVAMTAAATLWYLTAWDNAPGALLFAWAGCLIMLMVGKGDALKVLGGIMFFTLIAFVLVFAYQYAILPRIATFEMLALVMGLALVPLGILMAMNMAGLVIAALFLSFLALQSAYQADFAQTAQTLSSALVGLLIAIAAVRLFDYDRARFATRRLPDAVRRDVLDLARMRHVPDGDRFRLLALHRLSLYFAAAGEVADGDEIPRLGLIRDLSLGGNLLVLRQQEDRVSLPARAVIAGLREVVGDAMRDEQAGRPDDRALRERVDAAVTDPAITGDSARDMLMDAVIGLDLAVRAADPPAVEEEDG